MIVQREVQWFPPCSVDVFPESGVVRGVERQTELIALLRHEEVSDVGRLWGLPLPEACHTKPRLKPDLQNADNNTCFVSLSFLSFSLLKYCKKLDNGFDMDNAK